MTVKSRQRVPRTRNLSTMTESQFWGAVRSALRNAFRYWKPAVEAKRLSRKSVKGKRHKYEYKCAKCKQWYKDKEVQIDHIEPVGSLKSYEDLADFLRRLTPENPDDFQILCKKCHKIKTANDRETIKRRNAQRT